MSGQRRFSRATRPIGTADGEVRALWERAERDDLLAHMSRIEFMVRFALSNDNVDDCLVATSDADHLADIDYAMKGPLDPALYRWMQSEAEPARAVIGAAARPRSLEAGTTCGVQPRVARSSNLIKQEDRS